LLHALGVYDLANWTPGHPMALRLEDVPTLIYPVCRTADGVWVQFAQNAPSLYRAFLVALDLSHLYDDPRFERAPWVPNPDDARTLRAILLERFAERTWAQWSELFADESDISAEPLLSPGEVLQHPQARATSDVCTVEDPTVGPSEQLGALGSFHGCAPGVPGTAPTSVSSANWAPRPASDAEPNPVTPGDAPPLLSGITVLELATWIATPLASALLAELGARVIKIEPLAGDPMRGHGNIGWKCVQGKESLAVDLKTADGVEIVQRLAARADALVHNFRPGVPERLGIDPATLLAINPRLVHVYAGSYGSTGPLSDRPAFHVTFGAIDGGVMAQVGAAGTPAPDAEVPPDEAAQWYQLLSRANDPNPDFNAALATAAVLAMGVWHRDRAGSGQAIETRMLAANAYAMSEHTIDFDGRPPRDVPDAQRLGISARYRLYPAADGWVFLAAPRDDELARVGELIGGDDLLDLDDAALADRLGEAFAGAPADDWESRAAAAGVACVRADLGPLPRYAFGADWAERSGFVVESTPNGHGPYLRYGPAVTGERSVGPMGAADDVGAQTRALLAELGYADTDIDRFLADGIVGGPRPAD
ncbi:MAG: CoA transferase, partial [Acidimicrobiales bacterium]|nr:CoA transferase [Acidimicrobiales bacterium]